MQGVPVEYLILRKRDLVRDQPISEPYIADYDSLFIAAVIHCLHSTDSTVTSTCIVASIIGKLSFRNPIPRDQACPPMEWSGSFGLQVCEGPPQCSAFGASCDACDRSAHILHRRVRPRSCNPHILAD